MTKTLIKVNVGVYCLWKLLPRQFMMHNFMLSNRSLSLLKLHNIFTHSFSHYSLDHLLSNMFSLWSFGKNIEEIFGPKTLLQLYITGALFGSFVILKTERYHIKNIPFYTPAYHLGASGAVCSCIIYHILNFPNKMMQVNNIQMPGYIAGIIMVGTEALMRKQISIVSHSGHFGGFMAGICLFCRDNWKRIMF